MSGGARRGDSFSIVMMAILAAVAYGEVHDQVTAHLTVQYFTMGHPRIVDSDSPVVLALVWGFVATWWMGLALGLPVAACARLGSWPKHSPRELVRPLLWAVAAVGACALAAGVTEYGFPGTTLPWLVGSRARIPEVDDPRTYGAVWASHAASYAAGIVAAMVMCVVVLVQRWKAARGPMGPAARWAAWFLGMRVRGMWGVLGALVFLVAFPIAMLFAFGIDAVPAPWLMFLAVAGGLGCLVVGLASCVVGQVLHVVRMRRNGRTPAPPESPHP